MARANIYQIGSVFAGQRVSLNPHVNLWCVPIFQIEKQRVRKAKKFQRHTASKGQSKLRSAS